jgi:hypothetical protein
MWFAVFCHLTVAKAGDVWTELRSGIDHLHRTTAEPQDYHVILIDLSRPEIWLRATGPGENGQRTSSFAAATGALIAINGDLWDANNWAAYEPLGLAVGDGWKWRDDTDVWSFFACDPTKRCEFDPWGHLAEWSPRWFNAVGGMQDLLVIDGAPQAYQGDFYQQRHPRTSIGLSQDGRTLILLVADGRRPGALGMTFADLTNTMLEFGAYNAMNNDGGGSSTLVISGVVQNTPSDGAERIVANHLGIQVSDHTDPACVGVENSRQCVDATQMRTCIGGIDRGLGDCAAYGLTCEAQDLFAYCVDPRCANGGQANLCLDQTRIGMCADGVYREGDCAGYGLPCVAGLDTAWCWADFRQATPVGSSLGAPSGGSLTIRAGEQPTVWFELSNTGLTSWQPGVTRLAPVPRDQACPLAGPDWIAAHRAATLPAAVPPGGVGRFSFTLQAPGPGEYEAAFGLLDEGVSWFADPPAGGGPRDGSLRVRLVVTADGEPDAGEPAENDGKTPDAGDAPPADQDSEDAGDPSASDPSTTDEDDLNAGGGCTCRTGRNGSMTGLALLTCLLWLGRDPRRRRIRPNTP